MTSFYSLSDYPVTSYAQYLKTCYKKPLPDDEKVLKNIGKIYIELAVISSENNITWGSRWVYKDEH